MTEYQDKYSKSDPWDISDNCIAQWHLNDDAATDEVLDARGNHNGAIKDATGTPTTAFHHVAGYVGTGALDFDGTDDYVSMPAAAATALHGGTEASISLWIKKDAIQYGFLQLSGYASANGCLYPYDTATKVYLDVFKTARFGPIEMNSSVLEWHHLVITTKPGANGYKVYQNGVLAYQNTGEATVATDYLNFEIGRNSGGRYCDGKIDEVSIFNKVLTQAEIEILYNKGVGRETLSGFTQTKYSDKFSAQSTSHSDKYSNQDTKYSDKHTKQNTSHSDKYSAQDTKYSDKHT